LIIPLDTLVVFNTWKSENTTIIKIFHGFLLMKVQGNMLNAFGTILLYKMVGWFDDQNIGVEQRRSRFNPLHQNILCGVCIFIYIPYACV
jgi:hypothetical protein